MNPSNSALPSFRRATISDVPTLASIATAAFKSYPSQSLRYPNCSTEEYTRFYHDVALNFISRRNMQAWVAILEDKVVGFLFWSRRGCGIKERRKLPEIKVPECTVMKYEKRLDEANKAFEKKLVEKYGPHLFGEWLGVDHTARLLGVASGLSRIMAAESKRKKLPVFFSASSPDSLAFYERFGIVHGYERLVVEEPFQIDDDGKIFMYRVMMVEVERRKDEPIIPYRRRSPE